MNGLMQHLIDVQARVERIVIDNTTNRQHRPLDVCNRRKC